MGFVLIIIVKQNNIVKGYLSFMVILWFPPNHLWHVQDCVCLKCMSEKKGYKIEFGMIYIGALSLLNSCKNKTHMLQMNVDKNVVLLHNTVTVNLSAVWSELFQCDTGLTKTISVFQ